MLLTLILIPKGRAKCCGPGGASQGQFGIPSNAELLATAEILAGGASQGQFGIPRGNFGYSEKEQGRPRKGGPEH